MAPTIDPTLALYAPYITAIAGLLICAAGLATYMCATTSTTTHIGASMAAAGLIIFAAPLILGVML